MTRYQTEIVVPADRYVALQLPSALPEGRATVTIVVHAAEEAGGCVPDDDESEDIEWWEEFEDDCERVV